MERVAIPHERVSEFCRKWKIAEFSLFGSVLRDDFRADSDVDVLVTFEPDSHWTLFDLVHMEDELKELFGRNVDLVIRESVERSENPIRRKAILSTAQRIYVAGRGADHKVRARPIVPAARGARLGDLGSYKSRSLTALREGRFRADQGICLGGEER